MKRKTKARLKQRINFFNRHTIGFHNYRYHPQDQQLQTQTGKPSPFVFQMENFNVVFF